MHEYVVELLTGSFPNMSPAAVQAAVTGMRELREYAAFKHHLRDFLVQVRGDDVG